MHARLISFLGADPEKRETALQTIRETVIPTLRGYDGFAGYLALYDEANRRAKAVILWDSEEAANAAEETLAERRRSLRGPGRRAGGRTRLSLAAAPDGVAGSGLFAGERALPSCPPSSSLLRVTNGRCAPWVEAARRTAERPPQSAAVRGR